MDLIYDKDLVFPLLRLEPYLLIERPDMLYLVIRGCIQFDDVERGRFVEGSTGLAFIAWLFVLTRVLTIKCFCQYSCATGLPYTPWATEQEGMSQVVRLQCVLEGVGHMLLTDHLFKPQGSIFSG